MPQCNLHEGLQRCVAVQMDDAGDDAKIRSFPQANRRNKRRPHGCALNPFEHPRIAASLRVVI